MQAVIYAITHVATGRCYVGHTATTARGRWNSHRRLLDRGVHHSPHLQRAWTRYGADAFDFTVIEICAEADKLSREQHHIDTMDSVFNVARVAGSRLGVPQPAHEVERLRKRMVGNAHTRGRIVPDDEKARRAAACTGTCRTPEQRAGMARSMRGVPHPKAVGHAVSKETRAKIRAATEGKRPTMTGKHHRPETIERIRASNVATWAAKRAAALTAKEC